MMSLRFGIHEIEYLKKIGRKFGKDFGKGMLLILILKVFDYDYIFQSCSLKNSDLI
jgi:hypothetical protein